VVNFEIFRAEKVQVVVLQVVTPCILPHYYTASQHKSPCFESLSIDVQSIHGSKITI